PLSLHDALPIFAFSVFFILRKNYRNNFRKQEDEQGGTLTTTLTLSEEVTFLNKAGIIETLSNLPDKSRLVIDGTNSRLIDYDVLEFLHEFCEVRAPEKHLQCELINMPDLATRVGGH